MSKRLKLLVRDSRGASAVEYGIIITFIVIVLIAGLTVLATTTTDMWNDVSDNVVQD